MNLMLKNKRARLSKLSDAELIREGKAARSLCLPAANFEKHREMSTRWDYSCARKNGSSIRKAVEAH
jgi:hypothetical protein